jgi:hypothetical protein
VSAFAAGFTNLTQLLILRSLVFIGVCVEFAWRGCMVGRAISKLKQREQVLAIPALCRGRVVDRVSKWVQREVRFDFPVIHGNTRGVALYSDFC